VVVVNVRRLLAGIGLIVVVGAVLLWGMFLSPYPVMPEATAALASDERVTVTSEPWLTFAPSSDEPEVGLVLYTGARVPPEAYAPLARSIAAEGYLVVIPELPLNLAVLDANAASAPIAWYDTVVSWAVGGHSLGGAMAARFAASVEEADGLALLAAYPEDGLDLTGDALEAVVLLASEDLVADQGRVRDGLTQLPASADLVEIDGGNHAGFGWYGDQSGDGVATISREEQTGRSAAAIVRLLEQLQAPG
jgi:dienelactone hydrolase